MSYDEDDAQWDAWWEHASEELYAEHFERAVEEFTTDRLQSFYMAHRDVARAAADTVLDAVSGTMFPVAFQLRAGPHTGVWAGITAARAVEPVAVEHKERRGAGEEAACFVRVARKFRHDRRGVDTGPHR